MARKRKRDRMAYGVAVAVAVVAIAIATAYFALGSMDLSGKAVLPGGKAQQGQPWSALNSSSATPYGMLSLAVNGLLSVEALNVTYSGDIEAFASSNSSVQVDMPFTLGYARYSGASRMYASIDIPQIAVNATFTAMEAQNGTAYTCYEYLTGADNSTGLNCIGGQTGSGIGAGIALAGLLKNVRGMVNGSLQAMGGYEYRGNNCTLVSLSGLVNTSALSGNSIFGQLADGFIGMNGTTYSYSAFACLSDRYYVPLNLTATLLPLGGNDSVGIVVSMGVTGISTNADMAYVSEAP